MENLEWALHPVRDDDGSEMWWLLNSDGHQFCLGEYPEVEALADKLNDLIAQGNHGGELSPDDPRIIEWLTVKEAAEISGESPVTIRWAARNKIEGALPRPWRFPKASFDAWMRTGRNKRS